MKRILFFIAVAAMAMMSFVASESSQYKCMIQLENYEGFEAYAVISVVDADGNYQETLQVFGPDEDWHPDLPTWWAHREAVDHNPPIDAVTGASIAAGERSIFTFSIDKKYFDGNYKLRFETAVEEAEYHEKDLELDLTTDGMAGKFDGTGYIRYVRIMPAS